MFEISSAGAGDTELHRAGGPQSHALHHVALHPAADRRRGRHRAPLDHLRGAQRHPQRHRQRHGDLPETGQTWIVPISANAVPRKTAAAALVLDKSGSMSEDRGDGLGTKSQSVRDAANTFVDVMLPGDALSLTAFDDNAAVLAGLTALGDPNRPVRHHAQQHARHHQWRRPEPGRQHLDRRRHLRRAGER